MIGIVNYGLGNILAFANIYKRLNIPCEIVSNPSELRKVNKIILPGVGAFDWAMTKLNESGLRETLEELVTDSKVPVLGVCVAMHMMGDHSAEGRLDGLGWISGHVKRFSHDSFSQSTHLPHMGWNDVIPRRLNHLFEDLDSEARFYFLHSYHLNARNEEHVLAETEYGGLFVAAVQSSNIYGVQFHPEKSHGWGIQLLKNFATM